MRKDGQQRRLPHVGALAAHVGAGDDEHAPVCIQPQIVGNERLAAGAFHHGVASALDMQLGLVDKFRLHAIQCGGALRKGCENVQLRNGRRALQHLRQGFDQRAEQVFVKLLFARQGPVARAEHFVFKGLEFRRDESFRGFDGLPADVIGGCALGLRAVQFNEESLDAIEPELQARQSGAFAFLAFQFQQELLGVRAQQAQLVELRIEARRDHAAIA